MPGGSARTGRDAWRMGHSVRTSQPGILYLNELAVPAAASSEAVCAPLIAQKIADRLHKEKQQGLFLEFP